MKLQSLQLGVLVAVALILVVVVLCSIKFLVTAAYNIPLYEEYQNRPLDEQAPFYVATQGQTLEIVECIDAKSDFYFMARNERDKVGYVYHLPGSWRLKFIIPKIQDFVNILSLRNNILNCFTMVPKFTSSPNQFKGSE